ADFEAVCVMIRRLLVPGGHLVFSVEHPLFTAPRNPGWRTETDGAKVWPINAYLLEGSTRHRVDNAGRREVPSHHCELCEQPAGTRLPARPPRRVGTDPGANCCAPRMGRRSASSPIPSPGGAAGRRSLASTGCMSRQWVLR